MKKIGLLLFLFLGSYSQGLFAQNEVNMVDKAEKQQLVDSITTILASDYIFPEVASEMNALVQKKLKKGEYKNVTDPRELAEVLTADLQSVSKDLHLRVRYAEAEISRRRNASVSEQDSIEFARRRLRNNRMNNYGFKKVDILEGNIGYLELTNFFNVDEEAGAIAQAAMNFLSNTDALIIDLRQNGGGSPGMIQLITSYLYGPGRVHLNNFYHRPEDRHTQTWTLPFVPGKRRPDLPVYVLTSNRTFSAAEEFSYNLKHLDRATLIGEVTGGGAHPGGTRIATDRFTIWVPTGRAINPNTNTNWEGTGVKPHIEVSASEALKVAHVTALENMQKEADDQEREQLAWVIEGLKADQNPVELDPELLQSYAGTYGPRSLKYEDGRLFYQRDGRSAMELVPLSKDRFMIPDIPYFRIKLDKKDGEVVAIIGQYQDGRSDRSPRSR